MNHFEYQVNPEEYLLNSINNFTEFLKNHSEHLGDIKNKNFLEIGYGAGSAVSGIFMSMFHKHGANTPVYGIDIVDDNVNKDDPLRLEIQRIAKEKYKLFLNSDYSDPPSIVKLQMRASNMDFEDNFFDIIYSNAVFEHVKDVESTFKEIHRVLKPGGTSIHSWNPWSSLQMGGHDIGIPYYYPWAHLRLSKDEHILKLNDIFLDDKLRLSCSVKEHTNSKEYLNTTNPERMYNGAIDDLNKIRIKDMCNYAKNSGLTISFQKIEYYPNYNNIKHLLTEEIKNELFDYSEEELLCSAHILVLNKL
jgi:ubiquinone/menaquinone biosynthesis C-methylase UbiE